MNTRESERVEGWLNALWFLAFIALALIVSGCGSKPYGRIRSDTEPTAVGSRILAGYETDGPEPAGPRGKPVCALPVPQPPVVNLPGPPERPWAGTVRFVPVQPEPAPEPPAPVPVAPNPVPRPPDIPRPAVAGLTAGDALDVQVENHPEFSGRWTVRADGLLEVPDGGAFGPELLPGSEFSRKVGRVADLPPEDVGRSIVRMLKPYLVKVPAVRVTVLTRREG